MKTPKKILMVNFGGIGDEILFLPAISSLKKEFPNMSKYHKELIDVMKKYGFEPKRIKLCYPKVGMDANILLIEGVKNGKSGLKIEPSLIIHNEDGSYTDEVRKMFEE